MKAALLASPVLAAVSRVSDHYVHEYANGLHIKRQYLHPFARIHHPNTIVRVPLTCKYLFLHEVMWMLYVAMKVTIIVLLGSHPWETWYALFGSIFISYFLATTSLLDLVVLVKATMVVGIVEDITPYENAGAESKESCRVRTAEGSVFEQVDLAPGVWRVGEEMRLVQKADGLPYAVYKPQAVLWLVTMFLFYAGSMYAVIISLRL